MKELLILTGNQGCGEEGDAQRCASRLLPGAFLQGWMFKKKFVLKNYDASAFSPAQRRKSQLYALSFPPLGTF